MRVALGLVADGAGLVLDGCFVERVDGFLACQRVLIACNEKQGQSEQRLTSSLTSLAERWKWPWKKAFHQKNATAF